MKNIYSSIVFLFVCNLTLAQHQLPIFKDRKIINAYSSETLAKGMLDFRIGHRFGDMFGEDGGWPTFYGLENARDILIGFDYGINNDLLVGINRTKGAGPLRMLVNSYLKYKLAGQQDMTEKPLAVTVVAMSSLSTMPRSEEISAINNFPKFAHRLTYHFQMMVAKRFSEFVSLQFNVGYTHRNFVDLDDVNYVVNIGGAGRFQLNRRLAILLDANLPTRFRDVDKKYKAPLGIGLEWETGGGHVFQINFTNAGGLSEPDYLSYTTSDWTQGEFRLGFTISRQFRI
ncbi:MAG: hypothetical protein KDC53_22080 [Saprospiraceae bacterium]|nr:hypothetical protein [Saprospiraceae bacterium]